MGSLRIPSHLSTAARRGRSESCRNRGTMTVGPVTTKIAPREQGDGGRHVDHCPSAHRGEQPGDQPAHEHEPQNGPSVLAELADAQAQPALEEDECHGQRRRRIQQVSDEFVGVDQTGNGAGEHAEDEKQQDAGRSNAPGDPLGADSESDDYDEG